MGRNVGRLGNGLGRVSDRVYRGVSDWEDGVMQRQQDTTDVVVRGDTACLDIWYPDQRVIKYVQVGLMAVRAADDIRISYDFTRDGWKIEQASRFGWNGDDPVCDPDWQEVSFVQAWSRAETDEEENVRLGTPA